MLKCTAHLVIVNEATFVCACSEVMFHSCIQEGILRHLTNREVSLLTSDSIIPILRRCETAELAASEQVAESKRVLRSFDQQVQVYKPLADHAAIIFSVVNRISNNFKYFGLSLDAFKLQLASLFVADKKSKTPDSTMAISGHVLHLKHQLLVSLLDTISVCTFSRHQRLLLLLVSLEILVSEKKLSQEEYNFLARDLDSVEQQLDMLLSKGDSGPVVKKPQWITDKVFQDLFFLYLQGCFSWWLFHYHRFGVGFCSFSGSFRPTGGLLWTYLTTVKSGRSTLRLASCSSECAITCTIHDITVLALDSMPHSVTHSFHHHCWPHWQVWEIMPL